MKAPARLKRRAEFLQAAAKGRKAPMPGLVLQARDRCDTEAVRIGYTTTKKIGNAVVRNRARRRLRAAAAIVVHEMQAVPGTDARCRLDGHDLVLIGRGGTGSRPFEALVDDLRRALRKTGLGRTSAGGPAEGGS